MTIAIAFIHCKFDPDRVKSLAKIKARLGLPAGDSGSLPDGITSVTTIGSVGPEPNHVWANRLFAWAQEQTADDILQIQDDVVLPDRFLDIVKAARTGLGPEETLNLFTIGPWAKSLHGLGARFVSTADWMTGPCWLMSRARLSEHFRWIHEGVRDGTKETINEDTLLGLSHAAHGWRIFNPLPALANHDTSLTSHYGNEKARFNSASFDWTEVPDDLTDPKYWVRKNPVPGCPGGDIPHLGTAYSFTAYSYCRWVVPPQRSNGSFDHGAWATRADQIHADRVAIDGKTWWVA